MISHFSLKKMLTNHLNKPYKTLKSQCNGKKITEHFFVQNQALDTHFFWQNETHGDVLQVCFQSLLLKKKTHLPYPFFIMIHLHVNQSNDFLWVKLA